MQLTKTVINQMIEDLNKSIRLHNASLDDEDCFKDQFSEFNENHCHHCQLKEVIDDLDCLKSHLEPLNKNTIHHVQLIDAEAFRYALEHSHHVDSIKCYPVFNDSNAELNYPNSEPDSFAIEANTSRYAMDGNGFHVGYENVTYQWKAIDKSKLGIAGLPYLLSRWVINPDEYEIIDKDLPANEYPDPEFNHDDDCLFKGQSFDDCNCADMWDGYYQPENEFFHQEIQSIIDQLEYPEAKFDSDNREWTLGDVSFNLNQFENDINYSSTKDNGTPFICSTC